jgi:prepilin-type processing-associated H-X9-DG protein
MKPQWIRPLLLLLTLGLLSGCASSARRAGIAKLYLAKQGALACIMYADGHDGQYPPNIPALASLVKSNCLNQLTAQFDLVYTGAATNIAKPYATIILREKQAWLWQGGRPGKTYAFADGHAELHMAIDGQFANWENERIISP